MKFDKDGRFLIGNAQGGLTEISSDPRWSTVHAGGKELLIYVSNDGCRCWQLNSNGTMVEVTRAVIPEEFRVGAKKDYGMKAGDKVRLNAGTKSLSVQLRARFRPGDEGVVTKFFAPFHVEVDVLGKGKIRVASGWVDRIE